jgi:hypothetical protein
VDHLSAPVFGRLTLAEVARNIAVNTGQPKDRVAEAEIAVAKTHFARGLIDVDGLEAHVERVLVDCAA